MDGKYFRGENILPLTGGQEAVEARRTDGGQAENEDCGNLADFTEEGKGQELPGNDDSKVVDVELHQLRLCPVVEILCVENHQRTLDLPEELPDEETQTEQ